MSIINIHHNFLEKKCSKYAYPYFDYILLNVHEAYLHPRKPRGPFSIQKYNCCLNFIINEPQERCRSFCKILKYLCGEKNPDIKAQNYIDQLFKNEEEEILTQKELVQGDNVLLKYKTSRLLVDGNCMGYFLLWEYNSNQRTTPGLHGYIEFVSLINDIENTTGSIHGSAKFKGSISAHSR